jgi:hypothetical protein
MRVLTVVNQFSSQPWRSLLLAILVLLVAFLFLTESLPPTKKYFPGHEWFMASLCTGLALFFVICAFVGFRKRSNHPPP